MDDTFTTEEVLKEFSGRRIVISIACFQNNVVFETEIACYPEDFELKAGIFEFNFGDKRMSLLAKTKFRRIKPSAFIAKEFFYDTFHVALRIGVEGVYLD